MEFTAIKLSNLKWSPRLDCCWSDDIKYRTVYGGGGDWLSQELIFRFM